MPTPLAPIASLIGSADYPSRAMERGATGRVGFRLRVDSTGKPDGCVVSQSSGSADLDNATCDVMLARARFQPAHNAIGEAIRGVYSANLTWKIEQDAEPFTSEYVRVRDEIDSGGKIRACSVTPPSAAADLGGCGVYGDPRMLVHLLGRPLTGLAWVEMRVIKQPSTEPPIADTVPTGATKRLMARSTFTITAAGVIAGCKGDVVAQFDGRTLDLCAIGLMKPDTAFIPTNSPQPRQLSVLMEVVTQAR